MLKQPTLVNVGLFFKSRVLFDLRNLLILEITLNYYVKGYLYIYS